MDLFSIRKRYSVNANGAGGWMFKGGFSNFYSSAAFAGAYFENKTLEPLAHTPIGAAVIFFIID